MENTSESNSDSEAPVQDMVPLEATMTLLYEPPMDPWTRDQARLNSLRVFLDSTPAYGCLFPELFPNLTNHMRFLALQNEGLLHSLLSMATLVRDMFATRAPSPLYFTYKSRSLRALQKALSTDLIDEYLFTSILIQLFTDYTLMDTEALKRHLRGLYLVYIYLKTHGRLTSTIRFFARLAAQVDYRIACISGELPQWPAFSASEEADDRRWLSQSKGISTGMRSKEMEWALAAFEVENLFRGTYIFAKSTAMLRQMDYQAEEAISLEYEILLQQFELWKQRKIVIEQEAIERFARKVGKYEIDPQMRFLEYDYLPLQDHYYAKLLNQWRAAQIYASTLVLSTDNHILMAIDICRTYAALGDDVYSGPHWDCLFYAGLVLGTREREWIIGRCLMVAERMPVLYAYIAKMNRVWEQDVGFWNVYGSLFPHKDDSWFKP